MLSLGPLAFLQPWLLLGLLALPAIWLLLRLTPPAPRQMAFPPLALLSKLVAPEETPARTPWWLLLLRLAVAALIIIGLAGPVLNPAPELGGRGPLLLVVDDGWAAAPAWQQRVAVAAGLLEQAERDNRPVIVLRTAPDGRDEALQPRPPREVLEELAGWQPRAWSVDHDAAAARLEAAALEVAQPVWLADGIIDREDGFAATRRFADALAALGELQIIADPPSERAVLLAPGELAQSTQSVRVLRPSTEAPWPAEIVASGPAGEVLGRFAVPAAASGREAVIELDLPLDLRNRIARLELTGGYGVGGVLLFDERWRRRTVGIVGDPAAVADQPLLAEPYFVERALRPFAEIRRGSIVDLVEAPLSLLVITDRGRLDRAEQETLTAWVEDGGVLLRFAGPRLAGIGPESGLELGAEEDDPLLPVQLRSGDRQLGGALSWSEPLPLAPFPPDGPFAGLEVSEEAIVFRQVLAEPSSALADATLASLADGTPIVTGRAIGEGRTLLFHTTANTSWTSLPLSGVFVDMLRRIADMGIGAGSRLDGLVRADRVLAADGSLVEPPADLQPMDAEQLAERPIGPASPAGLYLTTEQRVAADSAESDRGRVARNLQRSVDAVEAADLSNLGRSVEPYGRGDERNLMPLLLTLATLLALADLVLSFVMRGLVPRFTLPGGGIRGGLGGPAAMLLGLVLAVPAAAQSSGDEARIVELTMETRLAYVRTGLGDLDERSRAGLVGLSRVLEQRSSIETGTPVAVDPALDDLALFPLLYWPVPPEHPSLADMTLENLEHYLRHGGMILFDTGDGGRLLPGQDIRGPGERRLGQLLGDLDLAPLEPMPDDHVLTRSFYLMQDLPGRYAGRPIWVDRQPQSVNDGVSSVIIGAHDWAGAWAEDEYGRTLYPVIPGGERQREMARRFGVNLVMYALTGNYKTDQVHIPALLERLGQ